MNWYKYIKADYEDTLVGFDEFDEEDDMDSYAEQARALASDSEINILSDKELARVAVNHGLLLGALWTSWSADGGFSFDIVVDPQYRRMGVGSNLVDQAMEIFNWESDAFETPYYDIDAVNEDMVRILEKKGFIIKERIRDHIIMTRPQ